MGRYIIRRLLLLIVVMFGVIALVYAFQGISSGDAASIILGNNATEEAIEELRDELGLNDPIIVQFFRYCWKLITTGSLGTSYLTRQPVMDEILVRFPYTLRLAFGSVAIGVLLGIPLGVLSAVKQYTVVDNVILAVSVFLSSVPNFWLSLMLILVFAVKLGILPSAGIESWQGWVLPMAVVAVQTMGSVIRNTRSSMLETIRQDYVRTARAKGQSERKIIINHALRNSLIPVVNAIGVSLSSQLGGALIIENIFSIPGIGQYAVTAINNRNYPSVLGATILLSFTFSVVNLLMDLIYIVIDPRLKTTFAVVKKRKRKSAAA